MDFAPSFFMKNGGLLWFFCNFVHKVFQNGRTQYLNLENMKYMKTKRRTQRGLTQLLYALLLMVVGSITGYAQSDCFTYEDGSNETVIDGLTQKGQAATSLTIPKEVTIVRNEAFTQATEAIEIDETDGGYTNYVLYDAAFHPTSGGTLSANKAYLQVPTDPEGSAKERLSIVFDDEETTEISTTNFTNFTNSDTWYDLQGRKVAQPTRGLYINNGKKYMIQ